MSNINTPYPHVYSSPLKRVTTVSAGLISFD
jgi:hypothetical protein